MPITQLSPSHLAATLRAWDRMIDESNQRFRILCRAQDAAGCGEAAWAKTLEEYGDGPELEALQARADKIKTEHDDGFETGMEEAADKLVATVRAFAADFLEREGRSAEVDLDGLSDQGLVNWARRYAVRM